MAARLESTLLATKGSKGVRMRSWTVARLERHQGERRRPVITRTRITLAGILVMLALPLTGVLLISIASGSATSPASPHLLHGYAVTVVSAAKSQIGARYASVGDTPQTGFSCVGLVHWAYARAGLTVPESAPSIAARYPQVGGATPAGAHLLPGDILLFVNTAWAGYSHAAIYVGNDLMVSADSPQTGVRLEPLNTPYWDAHWAGVARVPGLIQNSSGSKTPSTLPPPVHPLGQATGDTGSPRIDRAPQ
jgi:cell wall-associated NlpC family hydrolase